MSRRLAATTLALFAAHAAAAAGESGRTVDFTMRLTTPKPGTPSGLALRVEARGEGKPPPVRSLVYRAPAGTRFDTGALMECSASDEEFRVLGTMACPDESHLTIGAFSAVTGFGAPIDPLHADVHVFNGPSQLIEVITAPGSFLSPAVDRLTISGNELTAHPPFAPGGPPEGETTVESIAYEFGPQTSGGRTLITTPPSCPAGGEWTSTATLGFADGSGETVASSMPCERGAPLALAARPRTVVAGRRSRVRFSVAAAQPRCRKAVRIAFAGRVLRTNARGRARWAGSLASTRRYRATARRKGCGAATTAVRAVPG
jgi:hypothetical protein